MPIDFLQFLVNLYRVAAAYTQPLLEQRILNSIQEEYACVECGIEGKAPCVELAEEPIDLIEALAAVSKLAPLPFQKNIRDRLLKLTAGLDWDIWTDPAYLLRSQFRVDESRGLDKSLRGSEFVALHLLGSLSMKIEERERDQTFETAIGI